MKTQKRVNKKSEKIIHKYIINFLRSRYPLVPIITDLAGEMFNTKTQAYSNANNRTYNGYPDIFIPVTNNKYNGLFLEVKAKNIFRKDGIVLANSHYISQVQFHEMLRANGYKVVILTSIEEAENVVGNYLEASAFYNKYLKNASEFYGSYIDGNRSISFAAYFFRLNGHLIGLYKPGRKPIRSIYELKGKEVTVFNDKEIFNKLFEEYVNNIKFAKASS